MKGTVKSINPKKFGFIRGEDNKEYFFHAQDLRGHWDDLVTDFNADVKIEVDFNAVTTSKGLRAAEVSRLDWPN